MSTIVRINIILLVVLCFHFMSYAEVTPVADRTPVVRDAIVKAIEEVDAAVDVTDAHLASITALNLRNKDISELRSGDFSGLTGLVDLNLYGNKLSELPAGIFEGLTALTTIRLSKNSVDPLPFTVSLEKVSDGQFRAVAPAGALFDIVVPVTVTNGSITDGATAVTISRGNVASEPLMVTRTSSMTDAATVDIGTLPSLPRNHYGYALVKSDVLPLAVISSINTAPVFTDSTPVSTPMFTEGVRTARMVPENTDAGINIGTPVTATDADTDVLTYSLSGPDVSAFDIDTTTGQLKTKAALDYETKTQYTVTITASDGTLTGTITVAINVTDVDEVVTFDPPIAPEPPTTNTAPAFSEGDRTARVVPENTDAGVNIGTPVSATDTENDVLTYTLSGPNASTFDIDSTTGQLRTKVALDYETKRIYSVTINVADEALSDTIVVIIGVIDVNDTPISAGFVPVAERTPQVRDAIVAAVSNVAAASDVTESQVASITSLNLRTKGITSLKTGDFSGMASLSNLNLFGNQLRRAPVGLFNRLTALTTLRLSGNAINPFPLIVSLQQVSHSEFRAVIPSGAPFNVVIPIRVTDGSLRGGITAVTIPQGSVVSAPFTVDGTAAKVAFGTLPEIPRNHYGYTLTQSTIYYRTPQVAEAIIKAVGVNDSSEVTGFDLATITSLDLGSMDITSLKVDDFAGMISLQTLNIADNKLTTLPARIFSNLTALASLHLEGNNIETLPSDAFEGLTFLWTLSLTGNELTDLSGDIFDGIPNIRNLYLSNNKLTALPVGIFEGLTQIKQLQMNGNAVAPVPIPVSLQKVGTMFKAVVPTGAPFDIVLPIKITNGTTSNGANMMTIPIGKSESLSFTVTRTAGTIDAVTADIEVLPKLPTSHNGYAFAKGIALPLEIIKSLNSPPIFTEGADTTRSIRENTAAGQNVGDAVKATDRNTADTLTYTLGGTDAAAFTVDSTTGQLKTKASLDYETKDSYTVMLTVSDGKLTSVITLAIRVSDVNEAPTFTDGTSITREIAENTATGENIGAVITATDPDNDTLTYTLGGTDASAFTIDTATGQLKTSAALDYETKTSYSVTITASDGTDTATIDVTINVSDVTENRVPTFTAGTSTTRSVAENTDSGIDIGSPVSATDADNDTLTYSLGGTDASSFSIESTTGQLQTSAALDYETATSYTVTVSVSDGNGGTDSITVTINVTNVDETPANNAPVFTDGTSATRSVPENTPSGRNIGNAVGATDADTGDTLTYSLTGTDANSFDIVTTSGQLQTKNPLDYENKQRYKVTVQVYDGNNGTDSITVTINVTNVDETRTNNTKDRSVKVKEAIVAAVPSVSSAENVTEAHLAAITSLYISMGEDGVLQAGDFDGLTGLTDLTISELDSFPSGIFDNLTALETLDLYDSYFESFPSGIFDKLTALTYLDLGYGAFTSLPSGLFDKLTALETLYLNEGSFDSLPSDVFDKLTALTDLDLSEGYFDSLPSDVFDKLTALETLDLSKGYFDSLPSGIFDKLTALTDLDLSEGYFDSFPSGIFDKLTALETLYLNGGYFDSLPSGLFDNLTSLTYLDLYYHFLTTLPSGIFDNLTALETLDLSAGYLDSLPSGIFDNLTSLTYLDLRGNFLDIPALQAGGFFSELSPSATILTSDQGAPGAQAADIAVPESTSLLQNYPNPFNPETWIPYQLAEPAEVTLTIYDARGVVVRTLNLGLKSAGVYVSRSRAAHWDGRNSVGEQVAAGLYFYTFTIGDFNATRKMVIRK